MYVYKNDQIDKAIDSLEGDFSKLRDRVHALGVASIVACMRSQANQEATATRLNAIMVYSPYHAKAFSVWIGLFTPLVWNAETKLFVGHAKKKVTKKMCLDGKDKPFWECSAPQEPKPFSDIEAIFKLANLIAAKVKKGGDSVTTHPALLNALDVVVAKAEEIQNEEKIAEAA